MPMIRRRGRLRVERRARLDATLDRIRARFGDDAIQRGVAAG